MAVFILLAASITIVLSTSLFSLASSKSSFTSFPHYAKTSSNRVPGFASKTGKSAAPSHFAPLTSTPPANSTDKIVILTFGDTKKSQFTTAKPILDQYDYKASFFITCTYANDGDKNSRYHLSWNNIRTLQADGQDIESKGMTPVDLNNLSAVALYYEIGDSKLCLESHGINSPNIFAAKFGDVWNNPTVIDAISKYYQLADDGSANLMFLHCDGYPRKQSNCSTYGSSGTLNYANRYSIREWDHNALDSKLLHDDQMIFQKFVQEVNSGISFNNKKGIVDAIPIIAYHIVDNSLNPSSTDINLFAQEMKYLHDNNFEVIPMSDLGYDQRTNLMFIK